MWCLAFPFPSNGNAYSKMEKGIKVVGQGREFPFPSNGNAERKTVRSNQQRPTIHEVSIPFKREHGSKVSGSSFAAGEGWFPFPSNGNAERKFFVVMVFLLLNGCRFQFPSNGKADRKRRQPTRTKRLKPRFNSLQTGKRSASRYRFSGRNPQTQVSIPFKRESGYKVSVKVQDNKSEWMFQFPSNGKADRKHRSTLAITEASICFNSLQTGKRSASMKSSST